MSTRRIRIAATCAAIALALAIAVACAVGTVATRAPVATPASGELLDLAPPDPNITRQEPALPAGWRDFRFASVDRPTRYAVVLEDDAPALEASSDGGASALRRDLDLEPRARGVIEWTWKVEHALDRADCQSAEGDDCAARVLILYRYSPELVGPLERLQFEAARSRRGEYPPVAMLVYAWTEAGCPETWIESPSSSRVRVLPLRRGSSEAGRWLTERRDHVADYREAFGSDPPPIDGVALMVDTDDTGASARAWFRSVRFLAEDR